MKILKVGPQKIKIIIKKLVGILKKGGVIVYPTDTVYGLLADATKEKAIKKIFKIKKRSFKNPIPIFIRDIKMAKELAFINRKQENFLKMVWPGRVTVVLKRKNVLPRIIFGGEKTIGLRIPDYKLVDLLLKEINHPLTGTSANISGKPASTKIREVLKQFEKKEKPDFVLDAGNLKPSLPSVVIGLTGKKMKILRP